MFDGCGSILGVELTGLKTARFATGMALAMRISQWVNRPASDFMYPARW
jgi:hypothetical protein